MYDKFHFIFPTCIKMLKLNDTVTGKKVFKNSGVIFYQRKTCLKSATYKSEEVPDLIHTDFCGPMQTETTGKKRYFMTIIDDHSRFTIIYLLNHKDEVFNRIQACE